MPVRPSQSVGKITRPSMSFAQLPSPLKPRSGARAFRTAVLRGLGVLTPPLLTILIFLWIGGSVNQNVLRPVSELTRRTLVWLTADIRADLPNPNGKVTVLYEDRMYRRTDDGKYIPLVVYDSVAAALPGERLPPTASGVYQNYAELNYLRPYYVLPFLLSLFVLALYLLGKFMAAGIGRMLVRLLEWVVGRLPLVRSVYSGVKQVSDFMFNERELQFHRVVAVEYPRKGIWSIGFVTGEGFLDIHAAANDAVLSVFLPCSPMPFTGYVVNCLRTECVDLNMTLDQAFQFIISCGVVVPRQQLSSPAPEGLAPSAKVGADLPDAATPDHAG